MKAICLPRRNGSSFWAFCSSRLTFLKCEFWMIFSKQKRSSRPAFQNSGISCPQLIAMTSTVFLLSAKNAGIVHPPAHVCMRCKEPANPTLPHTYRSCTECHQDQEQIPSLWQWVRQTHFCRLPSGCHQELSEHIAGYFHIGDASDLRRVLGKSYSNNHIAFCLIRLRFPEDDRLPR